MSVDSIKPPSSVMQNSIVEKSVMEFRVIGVLQGICLLFIIIGLIVGILYMIKSKKTRGKKVLIGIVIIVVPFIIYFILNIIQFNMALNM